MNESLLERVLRRRLFEADDLTPGTAAAVRPLPAEPSPDLGKFALVSVIGRGGMGEVWKAWSKELKRHVAIKFVRGEDPEDEARFLREAQIAAGLNHPGIVAVHDVGRHEGRPYIVMPLLEGTTIDRAGLNAAGMVRAVRDAARALDVAHRQGVVHRDVKPSNLMIVTDRVQVMDFGVARVQRVDGAQSRAGAVIGTPQFMSPEQARGAAVDARSDVYSLGATLHALLAGAPPFENENLFELLRQVQESEPRPIDGLDRDLQTIILKCLEKDTERRYATASELADDLSRYLDREPVLARRAGWGYQIGKRLAKHRRIVAIALTAALTIVALSAYVFVTTGRQLEVDRLQRARKEAREQAQLHVEAARQAATPGAAHGELEKALLVDPDHELAHLEMGLILVREERFESARKSFSQAIALAPRLSAAYLERAYLDLQKETKHHAMSGYANEAAAEVARALQDLTMVLQTSTAEVERSQAEGLVQFVQGRYADCAAKLRKHVASSPGDARAWMWLGHALFHAEDHDQAVQVLDQALRLSPGNADLLQLRAHVRGRLAGRLESQGKGELGAAERRAALKELDETIQLAPRASAFYQRALLRREEGDLKGCIEDYTAALKREPTMARAHNNRGTARKALGDIDGAMQDYDEAIRINPQLCEPYANRANIHLSRNELAMALADCAKSIEANATYAVAWNTRGLIRRRNLETTGAEEDFSEAIRLDARYAEALANRGLVREDMAGIDTGRRRDLLRAAVQDLAMALEVAPPKWNYRKEAETWLARARTALKKTD